MKWNGTKRKVPAGCWTAVRLLIVVSLFSCLGSGIVQKFAEPIDKDDCHMRCRWADMTFWQYGYETDRCECEDAEGNVVVLYETFPPVDNGGKDGPQ